jgi:2-keto-4-pentenoate hydratase/2-oxohepta-3-ene-1,7-dioic acid hydratase in catechol pathway
MKVVRFRREDGSISFGALGDDGDVRELAGDPLRDRRPGPVVGTAADLRLVAPCQPGKLVCLAINYEGATGVIEGMREPLVFLKPSSATCGPGDTIRCSFPDVAVWGEAELAVVIGARLRDAAPEQVRHAIFGYTAANDVSADNCEDWDHHLARSKAADTFCPLGPWIDTEYDPSDRLVEGLQNGELIRQGRTSQRLWNDTQILSWLSTWMTLEPWDVILTGTPPRIVPRRYLEDGDIYTVRIEELGVLTNPFRRVSRTTSPARQRS